jgi:hypothetical protein
MHVCTHTHTHTHTHAHPDTLAHSMSERSHIPQLVLTIITRVTIMTMQFVVSNSNISSHKSIAQLNMANTAFETINVVKKP